jgi:hypothetical protein
MSLPSTRESSAHITPVHSLQGGADAQGSLIAVLPTNDDEPSCWFICVD